MDYTLHQLRIFLKIAETESITKAAEELHLTQPAVSIQLKNLQDQFDIPLTEVVSKKLYLTDFGKEIAQSAELVLNEVYAINYKTQLYRQQLSGRLKLSVVSTGKYVIPYFLSGFLKQHPTVELQMDVTNKARVVESLEKNEVDFSLVSVLPQKLRIQKIELMENKIFLIANADSKIPDKKITLRMLESLPLIFREQGSATRNAMENYLHKNQLSVEKKIELSSNEAVKQALLAGLGYSIMPLIGIKNELGNKQLQIVPLKGLPIKTAWNIISLLDKKMSPVANAFMKYLAKEKDQIISRQFNWLKNY